MTKTAIVGPIPAATLASIEADRRRQYRAEMAQELRQWLDDNKSQDFSNADGDYLTGLVQGWSGAVWTLKSKLDELSPPVVCDNETK